MKKIKQILSVILVILFLSGCSLSTAVAKNDKLNESINSDIEVLVNGYITLQHLLVSEEVSDSDKELSREQFSTYAKEFCAKYGEEPYMGVGLTYFNFVNDIITHILNSLATQNENMYFEGMIYYSTYVVDLKYLDYVLRHEMVTQETFEKDMNDLWDQFKQEWISYIN